MALTHGFWGNFHSRFFIFLLAEGRRDASLSTSFVVNDARHAIYIAWAWGGDETIGLLEVSLSLENVDIYNFVMTPDSQIPEEVFTSVWL